ncbi:MAG: ABC transporter substrate-binding protein [Negativicutes bacterium]|nr:ABC transporter substrate-binding protein [Negativicutes bacterium]
MKAAMQRLCLLALACFFSLLSAGCGGKSDQPPSSPQSDSRPLVVASMLDTEGGVVGQMIVQLLRAHDIAVTDRTQTGDPKIIRQAILQGSADIVLDYTGNGIYYTNGSDSDGSWHDPASAYALIAEYDLKTNNLIWLQPAPADNTEGLAVKADFASQHGIKDLPSLARYINQGGYVKMIAEESFVQNRMGLAGLQQAYGFSLSSEQIVAVSSGGTTENLKALSTGRDGINLAEAFGTDGSLADLGLVFLDDPLHVPPAYQPCPVVRGDVLSAYPQIAGILQPLFASLTSEALRDLNRRVTSLGQQPKDVAADYLRRQGLGKK